MNFYEFTYISFLSIETTSVDDASIYIHDKTPHSALYRSILNLQEALKVLVVTF